MMYTAAAGGWVIGQHGGVDSFRAEQTPRPAPTSATDAHSNRRSLTTQSTTSSSPALGGESMYMQTQEPEQPMSKYLFTPVATQSDIPSAADAYATAGKVWRNPDGSLGFNANSGNTNTLVYGYLQPMPGVPMRGQSLITSAFGVDIYAKVSVPGKDVVAIPQPPRLTAEARGGSVSNALQKRKVARVSKREDAKRQDVQLLSFGPSSFVCS